MSTPGRKSTNHRKASKLNPSSSASSTSLSGLKSQNSLPAVTSPVALVGPGIDDYIVRTRETAHTLGVSRATLWRMRQRGEISEPIRVSKGVIGWRRSTLDRLLDQREAESGGNRGEL